MDELDEDAKEECSLTKNRTRRRFRFIRPSVRPFERRTGKKRKIRIGSCQLHAAPSRTLANLRADSNPGPQSFTDFLVTSGKRDKTDGWKRHSHNVTGSKASRLSLSLSASSGIPSLFSSDQFSRSLKSRSRLGRTSKSRRFRKLLKSPLNQHSHRFLDAKYLVVKEHSCQITSVRTINVRADAAQRKKGPPPFAGFGTTESSHVASRDRAKISIDCPINHFDPPSELA